MTDFWLWIRLVFRPSELIAEYQAMEDALVECRADLEVYRERYATEQGKYKVLYSSVQHQRQHYATLVHLVNDVGYDVLPDDRGITLVPHSLSEDGKYLPFTEVH